MKKDSWDKEEYYRWAKEMFDPSRIADKPEILTGIRVLEVATFMNGPLATSFLAELGAEVIKFELPPGARDALPQGGDNSRYAALPGETIGGTGMIPFSTCRNKYHVTLDLAHPEGQELFRRLVALPDTDVVLENLRAGGMDRIGLGYRELSQLNPRLIYLATNGPGQWGPWADMVSYDLVGQAGAGFIHMTGFPEDDPQYPGIPTQNYGIGDSVGALWGSWAVLAALFHREKTGQGQFIECSQIDSLLRIMDWNLVRYTATGRITERQGNRSNLIAPYYVSKCKDGYVIIGCAEDRIFSRLCAAMGRPELAQDSRFKTNADRVRNQIDLYRLVDKWLLEHTRDELRGIADTHGFVYAPVMNAKDICECEHYLERGSVVEVDDPRYGKLKLATLPPHFSAAPSRIKNLVKPIGEDNEAIYGKYLGLSSDELGRLREERVI